MYKTGWKHWYYIPVPLQSRCNKYRTVKSVRNVKRLHFIFCLVTFLALQIFVANPYGKREKILLLFYLSDKRLSFRLSTINDQYLFMFYSLTY
jgi:hypothetical protein